MFEYKDCDFFTRYFKKLPYFDVETEFSISTEEDERNLYVGYVNVIGAIYPIRLRVEIPSTFPHNHLVFRTKSLYGYPHLIYTGKIKYGSWFCLNTPFGETVEGQLDLEVERLRGWIKRELVEGRPPIIKDEKTIRSLALIDAYEFENLDEMNEFRQDSLFCFIGDFAEKADNFKNQWGRFIDRGHFMCVKHGSERVYAYSYKLQWDGASFNNCSNDILKIPYIIVDESPNDLSDFIKLKEQFNWDEATCEFLLPNFHANGNPYIETSVVAGQFSTQEALNELDNKEKLVISKRLRPNSIELWHGEIGVPQHEDIALSDFHAQLLLDKIKQLKIEVLVNNGYNKSPLSFNSNTRRSGISDEEYAFIEQSKIDEQDYLLEKELKNLHYFCIGLKSENSILWHICYTCHAFEGISKYRYNIGLNSATINQVSDCHILYCKPEVIAEDRYFGRGAFCQLLCGKKIGIIGVGAIGSMVAESLARSGVPVVGLWDNDIVEPGNICRSVYDLYDLGNSKLYALKDRLQRINPYIKVSDIHIRGYFDVANPSDRNIVGITKTFTHGSFYGNINYSSQEIAIKEINKYDILIDCTANNEILHFLSYAVPDKTVISLCITNHSNELVCATTTNGNPFEIRKAYLAKLVQDTKNYYHEGSGCYSPTFLATNSDIASLVQLCIRDINKYMSNGKSMPSTIYSHTERGVLADRLVNYKLEGYDIRLAVSNETLLDAEEMDDIDSINIGYVFGCYSADGKQIMITHFVENYCAHDKLADTIETSKGVIDYVGDYAYSCSEPCTYHEESFYNMIWKAENDSINTNNPLLAVRNPNRDISFFLYINNKLVPFIKQNY